MEGKEWVWDHGSLVEAHVAEAKKRIEQRAKYKQDLESSLEFAKFLKQL
jgi:hypothetical protein